MTEWMSEKGRRLHRVLWKPWSPVTEGAPQRRKGERHHHPRKGPSNKLRGGPEPRSPEGNLSASEGNSNRAVITYIQRQGGETGRRPGLAGPLIPVREV
jgi:hypothetical protein